MTNAGAGDQQLRSLLLPKLKDDCDVRAGEEGSWDFQPAKAFNDIASSLDYRAPGEVKSVSSVPTIWARPLSMEMALHNDAYPIRDQMIPIWQGMLATLALAEVRGLPLQAQLLQLAAKRDQHLFARSAYELLPDPVNALYTLPREENPWADLYLFTWNNRVVGMTSPSTLVVPSEEGQWEGLQWWNSTTGKLEAPHRYLDETEKKQLAAWLENLRREVRNHNGNSRAIDRIVGWLNDYIRSLGVTAESNVKYSESVAFFGAELTRGALVALNNPIKAEARESNVQVIASADKEPPIPLLIVDPKIANDWNETPQSIWIHDGKNLASVRDDDLSRWREGNEVRCLRSQDLFLPELKFIDQEGIFPGGLLPEGGRSLPFNNRNVTPLLPLNPLLLDYFTPEELVKRVQCQTDREGSITVTLDLPLSGMGSRKTPQNYRISQTYSLQEGNALPEVPVLEVWPNFRSPNWREYYAFYYDATFGTDTFEVNFPDAEVVHSFKEGGGSYQMVRLEKFPPYIECKDSYQNLMGLILLATPKEVTVSGSWIVGVDFGTSFTNVFVNKNGKIVEQLELTNLHCKVTDVPIDTRFPVLFEFFIPEKFVPAEKPLPMSTVLTNRGARQISDEGKQAIFDGRIYVPDLYRFEPQQNWIQTNLKWLTENLNLNQLFLKHLALQITACAASEGVQEIQWSLSYPSAFSTKDRNQYARNWQRLTTELAERTGIQQKCPLGDDVQYFCTESLAVAQYFADREGHDLVSTTCIDMGGGTSDISIWQDNKLLHQCSLQLAGQHLLSQFIELNLDFLRRFDQNPSEWQKLKGPAFAAKLDVWMRLEASKWLEAKRDSFEQDREFQGLVRLIAIGVSGLYFYIGSILAALREEGKLLQTEITPVYIGGNGSRILNWLSEGGEFDRTSEINSLLSRMLSVASEFPDTEEPTRLSQNPKDEVACGLVLGDTKLQGMEKKEKDPIVAGEKCQINDEYFLWQERLLTKGKALSQVAMPELSRLQLFIEAFHGTLSDLNIGSITPIEGYEPEFERESPDDPEPEYNQKLWRAVKRELRNSLTGIQGTSLENLREEPPFILGLKALLRVLGKEWAGK
jgi:hypothetical protein